MPSRLLAAAKRWIKAAVPSVPQLFMRYGGPVPPAESNLPEAYRLRAYQDGDVSAWVELMNANGQLGAWDEERAKGALDGGVPGMQFFILFASDQIVACSSVNDRVFYGEEVWEIGWIATQPQHQRLGLGSHVTIAAVRAAMTLAARGIVLWTDDYRLPAIRTYLKLGFVPTRDHRTYDDRWTKVFALLGEEYRPLNPFRGAADHR